jgi:arginyl-tRNA synthetase
MEIKEAIAELLAKQISSKEIKKADLISYIEIPKEQNLGDFAFPCFKLSSILKKNPVEIAKQLEKELKPKNNITQIKATGPYLNFFVDKISEVKNLLSKINPEYGGAKENEKILVEHTSINPNASPHVGRTRNSIIADSIVRILRFRGNKVETHYYVNDVSKQIAMLALIFKPKDKFEDMLSNYVKISNKVKDNPELEKNVFELLEKFEKKDKQTTELFKKIVNICVEGQKKILENLDIKFDKFDYESEYIGEFSKELLEKFEKTGKLFEDEEKRIVLNQKNTSLITKMKAPYFVLARSNKTGLYGLRDIAYTIDKMKKGRNIIVLGEDQKLYFEQIKEALKLLGEKAPEVVHYSFVLIQTEEGAKKMSTRRGELVLLEDFLKETTLRAQEEIKKRKTKGDAKKIAIAAIKYSMLRNDNDKNIIFSWDKSLNFEGDSGPYLQYSYARASSIIKKAKKQRKKELKFEIPEKLEQEEIELVKQIEKFPSIIESAEKNLSPSIIAHYAFELSQAFNTFYHNCPVLKNKEEAFRLKLVEAFRITLKNSLYLLGIEVMEEM